MAFETIDEWRVERRLFVPGIALPSLPEFPTNLPFRGQLQKAPSVALAVIFHAFFLYFLITSAFDRKFDIGQSRPAAETTMTMIELGDSLDKKEETEPASNDGKVQSQPAGPIQSEIDSTVQTELPPEWSVGRITVARVAASSGEKSGSLGDIGSGAAGKKGGGVYDPFAGAAPDRKLGEKLRQSANAIKAPSLVERVTGFFGFGAEDKISSDAFQALVQSLRQRLPRAKGSVELVVSIDGGGKVKSAKILGGTASAQVKFFVRNAVLGKRLAGGRVASKNGGVKLPVISFG